MYHGNLAYELELPAPAIKRAMKAKPNAKVRAKRMYRATAKCKAICWVLAFFAVAFTLCWRYVAIFDQSNEIARATAAVGKINAHNSQIQMEIEKATERSIVAEFAKNELGMIEPDPSQFVFMMPSNRDRMQHLGESTNESSVARNWIQGLVAYFQ